MATPDDSKNPQAPDSPMPQIPLSVSILTIRYMSKNMGVIFVIFIIDILATKFKVITVDIDNITLYFLLGNFSKVIFKTDGQTMIDSNVPKTPIMEGIIIICFTSNDYASQPEKSKPMGRP